MKWINVGFKCKGCGEITDKPSKKGKREVCPSCSADMIKWERPLNERPGRCTTCSRGDSFTLHIVKGELLRYCNECKEWFDPTKNIVIRKGVMK